MKYFIIKIFIQLFHGKQYHIIRKQLCATERSTIVGHRKGEAKIVLFEEWFFFKSDIWHLTIFNSVSKIKKSLVKIMILLFGLQEFVQRQDLANIGLGN